MNFFAWMNVEDYQATFSVKPRKDLTLWLDYHFFRLAEAKDAWYWSSGKSSRRDRTGNSGRDVGQEVDLLAQWQITKNLEIFAGYCHFFTGEFIQETSGSERDADWLFVQCQYRF